MLVDSLGRVNVLLSRHWWNSNPRSALAANSLDKLPRFFRNSRRHENKHSISSNYIFTHLLWDFTKTHAVSPAARWWLSRGKYG